MPFFSEAQPMDDDDLYRMQDEQSESDENYETDDETQDKEWVSKYFDQQSPESNDNDEEAQPSAKRLAVDSSEPEEQKIQGSAKQKIQGSANQVVTWQITYGLDSKESIEFLPPLSTKSYKNSRNESALFYDVSTKKFQDEFGSVFFNHCEAINEEEQWHRESDKKVLPECSIKIDGVRLQFILRFNIADHTLNVVARTKSDRILDNNKANDRKVYGTFFPREECLKFLNTFTEDDDLGNITIVLDGEAYKKDNETNFDAYVSKACDFPPTELENCTDFSYWNCKVQTSDTIENGKLWFLAGYLEEQNDTFTVAEGKQFEKPNAVLKKGNSYLFFLGRYKNGGVFKLEADSATDLRDKLRGKVESKVIQRWKSYVSAENLKSFKETLRRFKLNNYKQIPTRYAPYKSSSAKNNALHEKLRHYDSFEQADDAKLVGFHLKVFRHFVSDYGLNRTGTIKPIKFAPLFDLIDLKKTCDRCFAVNPESCPEGIMIHLPIKAEDYYGDKFVTLKVKPMYTRCDVVVTYFDNKEVNKKEQDNIRILSRPPFANKWFLATTPNHVFNCGVLSKDNWKSDFLIMQTQLYGRSLVVRNCTVKGYLRNPVTVHSSDVYSPSSFFLAEPSVLEIVGPDGETTQFKKNGLVREITDSPMFIEDWKPQDKFGFYPSLKQVLFYRCRLSYKKQKSYRPDTKRKEIKFLKDKNCIEVNYTPLIPSVDSEQVSHVTKSVGGSASWLLTNDSDQFNDRTFNKLSSHTKMAAQNAMKLEKTKPLVAEAKHSVIKAKTSVWSEPLKSQSIDANVSNSYSSDDSLDDS